MACILPVVDETDLQMMLAEVPADNVRVVVGAEDRASAPAPGKGLSSFALLVTDINLPGLLDGIASAARFRTRCSTRPVPLVTGRLACPDPAPSPPAPQAALTAT